MEISFQRKCNQDLKDHGNHAGLDNKNLREVEKLRL